MSRSIIIRSLLVSIKSIYEAFLNDTFEVRGINIDLKHQSKKLAEADNKTKMNYVVSPSGYGIHWPDIDEDLSIDGLLGVKHKIPKNSHKSGKVS